jgi:hypothetical protein
VVAARDHGHPGRQVAHRRVGGVAHARLVVVERVVLAHNLLARRQSNLDGAVYDGAGPLLDRLFDRNLDELHEVGLLLQEGEARVDRNVRDDAVKIVRVDVVVGEFGVGRADHGGGGCGGRGGVGRAKAC